jgi:mannose-6-phosphate isomerase-like protein (cupin superfamily)
MTTDLRRIITGHNEHRKSVVAADKPPFEIGTLFEMWLTDRAPCSYGTKDEVEQRRSRLEPPEKGTAFRFFRVDPEDPTVSHDELERQIAAGFAGLGADHCRPDTARSPPMHKTRTVDYVIVLQGEVTLLLDEDEVNLKPFDVVIQRGTNHAWVNKSGEPALLAGVLVDAEPD